MSTQSSNFNSDISKNLKKIKEILSKTTEQIANDVDIPARTIGGYERNERTPSVELPTKLLNTYNISANWFLTGKGPIFYKNRDLVKLSNPKLPDSVSFFRSRLQEIQTKNRLLDREMAKLLKISERDYMSLCVGKKRPNIDVIDRIKENFNVDTDWLLYGEETTPQAPQPAQPEQINSQTLPPLTPKQYKKLLKLLED